MLLLPTPLLKISSTWPVWLVCLLVGALLPARAQPRLMTDTATTRTYEEMPPAGIVLDKGWKFQAGDNPAWASPRLDDRNWMNVNPSLPPRKLPQLQSSGIGWLRIRFRLGSRIRERALFLLEDQFLASEIYLNGKRIQRYGTVSNGAGRVQPARLDYFDALELTLDGQTEQVLAIRFAVWPPLARFNDFVVPYCA